MLVDTAPSHKDLREVWEDSACESSSCSRHVSPGNLSVLNDLISFFVDPFMTQNPAPNQKHCVVWQADCTRMEDVVVCENVLCDNLGIFVNAVAQDLATPLFDKALVSQGARCDQWLSIFDNRLFISQLEL
jgi:hypothetical protein